jgi:hypothetical protein
MTDELVAMNRGDRRVIARQKKYCYESPLLISRKLQLGLPLNEQEAALNRLALWVYNKHVKGVDVFAWLVKRGFIMKSPARGLALTVKGQLRSEQILREQTNPHRKKKQGTEKETGAPSSEVAPAK